MIRNEHNRATAGHVLDEWRRHLLWCHERLCYRRRTIILNSHDQDFFDNAVDDYCHALDMVWAAQERYKSYEN